jgi:hypothetical protein
MLVTALGADARWIQTNGDDYSQSQGYSCILWRPCGHLPGRPLPSLFTLSEIDDSGLFYQYIATTTIGIAWNSDFDRRIARMPSLWSGELPITGPVEADVRVELEWRTRSTDRRLFSAPEGAQTVLSAPTRDITITVDTFEYTILRNTQ